MDLKLAFSHDSKNELYSDQLTASLDAISPSLLAQEVWKKEFVEALPCFSNDHVGVRCPIQFNSIPPLMALELKLYWAKLLSDPRHNSRSNMDRRRLPMDWFREKGTEILEYFQVASIADIPYPDFPIEGFSSSRGKKQHNTALIKMFASFKNNCKKSDTKQDCITAGIIERRRYPPGRITIVGDFHKKICLTKEQFQPLSTRNIIFYNDIYSEDDIRFNDLQRQSDWYLNFYLFPKWLRPAVKEHVLQKVSHGELSPKTLQGYYGRLGAFRDFMHEKFSAPSPELITDNLIDDHFIAWGNEKDLTGKNWYTDALAMLITASRMWPEVWPALSVSPRATKKIKKVHYKNGLGRIGHNQESANRSYSQRIVDELRDAVAKAPEPIPEVFGLILGTGMRAEDGHAVLFNCLEDDPNDQDFMLLTFWQNKVRKWNVKPLLKKEPSHAELIGIIERQRARVIRRYTKPTKYLFPQFAGSKESFLASSYTRYEIRCQCIKRRIKADDGSPLSFSWHPLRHTKGTSLAKGGHDILSIMMELGHSSPDMATVYVNNRLELKKKALLEHGGGRFYTIEGRVDSKVSELLVRKDQINATRVCGGACAMPSQLGDWCEHANACYTCKHYRADSKDLKFFKLERAAIICLIEEQQEEALILEKQGKERMSQITNRRLSKNKEVYKSLSSIVHAIEHDGQYKGKAHQLKQVSLELDQ